MPASGNLPTEVDPRRDEHVIIKTDDDDPKKAWLNLNGEAWAEDAQAYAGGRLVNVFRVTLDKGDIRRVAGALLLMGETTEGA